MLRAPAAEIKQKAERLAGAITRVAPALAVDVMPSIARSGGGTLPTFEIPSYAVRLRREDGAEALAERLRTSEAPVVGRVGEGWLWLDARTLLDGDEEAVLEAVRGL
jgi:L-seryl-tRNA(Ser) seleniumtransferase